MTSDIIFFAIVAAVIIFRIKKEMGRTVDSEEETRRREAIKKHIREQIKKAEEASVKGEEKKPVIDIMKLQTEIKEIQSSKKQSDEVNESKKQSDMKSLFKKDNKKILNEIEDENLKDEVAAIIKYLPNPSLKLFILGAKKAYEMTLNAFKDGDKKLLSNLLTPKIYNEFVKSIDERGSKKEKLELNLISILENEIVDAKLTKKTIKISMKFVTEQISFIVNEEGDVVKGNKQDIQQVSEIWTFKRDIDSKTPDWKVISKVHA